MDELVSGIYAAANGRADWATVLGQVARHLNLWTVQVLGLDKRNGHLMFSVHGGAASPQTVLDYFRRYSAMDPRVGVAAATPVGQWFHCHEHFDEGFVAGNAFYQDFLIPGGGRYVSSSVLIDSDDVTFMLAFMRGPEAGPMRPNEMDGMEKFRHHFAEALRNLVHVRATYAELGMSRELLNQLAYPMLLIDPTRGLWHRNEAAARLLAQGGTVVDRGGFLLCRDPDSDRALAEALFSLQLAGGPEQPPPARRRAVHLQGVAGNSLMAFVSAVRPSQVLGAFGEGARALVVLHDPQAPSRAPDPFILAECFDLTPAEARVAVQLAKGASASDIALAAGQGVATVRSHIQKLLSKTGASHQAELVRMLTELPGRI